MISILRVTELAWESFESYLLILDMYNTIAVDNKAGHGGFLYETFSSANTAVIE